jgi:hypothetical protein
MVTFPDIIAPLGAAIGDPRQGLPEEVFLFASRITPLINVDVLTQDDRGGTLQFLSGSVQLLSMGILGEQLDSIHTEFHERPHVREGADQLRIRSRGAHSRSARD